MLATEPMPPYAEAARRLGERTGQLHLALASVDDDPDFAPESVTGADIESWRDTTVANLRDVLADLHARSGELAPHLQDMIAAIARRWELRFDRTWDPFGAGSSTKWKTKRLPRAPK